MRATAPHPVGREEELEAVVRLLDAPERLPRAVVLSGEAGIGKTTVWLAGIDEAAGRGYRVLSSRPSEAETGFSFAGLTDLLGSSVADVLPDLPPVQRRALEAALLLGESDVSTDDRVVAVAFLAVLRVLSRESRLCLAVDDIQWLDKASLAALRYALDRLDDEPVAALLAVRGDVPAWLRRAIPEGRLQTVEICELSVGATYELLHAHLDLTLPRPTLIRLWETSRGNPFFALELARALRSRGGSVAPGEELPIPSDLGELLRGRLEALSAAALAVAESVAALADPTVSLMEAAGTSDAEAGLTETLARRILELDGERLRFTHPLLGSTIVAHQVPSRRRALHARLASIVPTSEERSRHLALSTTDPNREIAAALEEAARSARTRGAPAAAADLAEHALRLTPRTDQDDARRRLLFAADTHDVAGDTDRAIALLERERDQSPAGPDRAEVIVQLADVQDDPRAAGPLYLEALAEAGDDDALTATIHIRLSGLMAWGDGFEQGHAHAELAVRAARRTDDAEIRCRAKAAQGEWQFRTGRGIQRQLMDEAVTLERSLEAAPLDGGPSDGLARQLVWGFELESARELLHRLLGEHRARSDADGEATVTWWLGLLEWRAGNWEDADRYAAASFEIRAQLGRVMPTDNFPRSVIAAHRGRIDDARESAEREMAGGADMGIRISQSGSSWVLGFIDWSLGDGATALGHLKHAYELRNAFMLDPGQRIELGDLLEVLIAVGELEEADGILASWEERASALDRAWALAILARCRALLLAARGDLEGVVRAVRPGARRACSRRGSVPPCTDASRSREDAASCEEACRRTCDARRRPRRLRTPRRSALGRTDAGRGGPHRRARAVARRADGGRAPNRRPRRRGLHEP